MLTWEAVVEFGKTLPDVEESTWDGTPELVVHGKGFVRLLPECDALAIRCTLCYKDVLLHSGVPSIFTTHDYDGFGAILVRLDQYDEVTDLEELITEAWRIIAALPVQAGEEG